MSADKLVDSAQLDASLTYEAGKIRAKLGSSAQLDFDLANGKGFGDYIDAIPSGGGISVDDIATNAISGEITISESYIGIAAFAGCSGLTKISAPAATEIHSLAFLDCTGVEQISLPSVTTIRHRALNRFGKSGTSIYLPSLTSFNNAVEIPSYSGSVVPFGDSYVSYIVLPIYSGTTPTYFAASCPNLLAVDLGNASRIDGNGFNNSASLDILVLRKSTVTTLANINAFTNTPFASGKAGGTLYVPSALISSYQSETNWSTILGYANNQIKSIESTHTDPNAPIDLTLYYADGTLIPT